MLNEPTPEERENGKKKLRNLHQYKNLTEEQLDRVYEEIYNKSYRSTFFEKRINEKLDMFKKDYDIDDLKINDMDTLRAMIQAMISLEDYEQFAFKLQRDAMDSENEYAIQKLEKITKIMNGLRSDISKFQEDLKITRKARKSDREESVIAYIDNIKERARKFSDTRFGRIFCPKCKMLLGTIWVLYPDNSNNKFWMYCKRCDERVIISFPDLVAKGLKNIPDVPEF